MGVPSEAGGKPTPERETVFWLEVWKNGKIQHAAIIPNVQSFNASHSGQTSMLWTLARIPVLERSGVKVQSLVISGRSGYGKQYSGKTGKEVGKYKQGRFEGPPSLHSGGAKATSGTFVNASKDSSGKDQVLQLRKFVSDYLDLAASHDGRHAAVDAFSPDDADGIGLESADLGHIAEIADGFGKHRTRMVLRSSFEPLQWWVEPTAFQISRQIGTTNFGYQYSITLRSEERR